MKKEIWKECKYRKKNKLLIFENYLVSNLGRVKNKNTDTIVELLINEKGYNVCNLLYKNMNINIRIDKLDNRLKNIQWVRYKHELFTDIQVEEICKLLLEGYDTFNIITKLNLQCDPHTISDIRNKKSYKHITDKYPLKNFTMNVLTDDIVEEICKLNMKGYTRKQIIEKLNLQCSKGLLTKIKKDNRYKHITDKYPLDSVKFLNRSLRELNDKQANIVCELITYGYSNKEIHDMVNFNCKKDTIKDIRGRKTYKEISQYYEW